MKHLKSSCELLERYDVFFLDAYGVLVSTAGALPGAAGFLEELRRQAKPYFILTNDASRLPSTIRARYARFGLEIEQERIVTSGSLLMPYFAEHALAGAPTIVLGTADSRAQVQAAGGVVVEPGCDTAEVLVLCDDDGYELKPAVDQVITTLFRRLDRGEKTRLVLPNPDLLYLASQGTYGITSGSIALVIEAALELRYPASGLAFDRLGKPHAPMFMEALGRAGRSTTRGIVMVGDQLETDIRGARDFGLDSVLLGTGLSTFDAVQKSGVEPTYFLSGLGPATPP